MDRIYGNGYTICGLTPAGQAHCWGRNRYGLLGDGTRDDRHTPEAVAGEQRFVKLAVGGDHVCGLDLAGDLWCWGANSHGQAGDARAFARATPEAVVGENLWFDSIISGPESVCGRVWGGLLCWGDNTYFQFQNAATGHLLVPTAMENWPLESVVLGRNHICGLTSAGQAYCWGSNGTLQLGIRSTGVGNFAPTVVDTSERFVRLATRDFHTCGINSQGAIFCWGYNYFYQLGSPTQGGATNRPTQVPVEGAFTRLAVGRSHTCVLNVGGEAYCWGRNASGELGNGQTSPQPGVPGRVATEARFVELAAGEQHTCGRTAEGAVYCWGDDKAGAVGVGAGEPVPTPQKVEGLYDRIDAGGFGTCGLRGSELYCWGANARHQLGPGHDSSKASTPTKLEVGFAVRDVSMGAEHVCAIGADRIVRCWGKNAFGALGDGAAIEHLVPVRVVAP